MKSPIKSLLFVMLIVASLLLALAAYNTFSSKEKQQPASVNVIQQPVAPAVYELAYSPRHNQVFVMAPVPKDAPKEEKPQVMILNDGSLKPEGATELPVNGFGVVLDNNNDKLYISTGDTSVISYDVASHKVKGKLQLSDQVSHNQDGTNRPTYALRQLWFDAKNQRLYIPGISWKDSVLYVVDTQKMTLIKTITNMGIMATGITQAPDGGDIYLSNWQHEIVVVDSNQLDIKKRFNIPVDQPLFLAYNTERRELLAVDEGLEKIYDKLKKNAEETGGSYQKASAGNTLVVIDPETGKLLQTIQTGKQPVAVKADEKAGRIYVTGRGDGTVHIYNTKDYSLLNTIMLNSSPNSIAINEHDDSVYISVKRGPEDKKTDLEKAAKITFR